MYCTITYHKYILKLNLSDIVSTLVFTRLPTPANRLHISPKTETAEIALPLWSGLGNISRKNKNNCVPSLDNVGRILLFHQLGAVFLT